MIDRTPQIPSFPSFRHPRYSRKALHRRFHPSAFGRHDLASRLGPLKRILAPPVDECLLCCGAGLGVHPTFSDLSAVPEHVITLRPYGPIGVWSRKRRHGCVCGEWVIVLDTLCNAMILILSEVTILLLRDVDDCGRVIEPGS